MQRQKSVYGNIRTISAHTAFAAAHSAYAAALKNIGVAFSDYARADPQSPPPQGNHGIVALLEEASDSMEVIMPSEEQSVSPDDQKSSSTMDPIKELEDGFVKASESADKVSKILEANYDSIYSSPDGIISEEIDYYAPEDNQTHSMILETILAWENMLYDEVKAGKEMKNEYKKKVAALHKLTKRGTSTLSLVQTKEMVNHLRITCTVQTTSINSIISNINRIRDEQLYPKLLQLVNEMGTMWESMGKQHENQLKMMHEIQAIKISQLGNESNDRISIKTKQLHVHVKLWCLEFHKLVQRQKDYIRSLNSWLKVNLMPIDDNLRGKVSSEQKPKIHSLIHTWRSQLEKLRESQVQTSIYAFAAATDALIRYQSDKTRMIERCEVTRREINRKTQKFKECRVRQIPKRNPSVEKDIEVVDDIELTVEHQIVVDALKRRLEEEEGIYRRLCYQLKSTSLGILKRNVSEIFMDMLEFSRAYMFTYVRKLEASLI